MSTQTDQSPWLRHAWRVLGASERRGAAAEPRIVACFRDAGHPEITSDEIAWCAAFVGACLQRAGIEPTGSLLARSYLAWGARCDPPRPGAIAVLSRGADPTRGHVGFLLDIDEDGVVLLGGNQSDAVTVERYPRARLLDLRWPQAAEASPQDTDLFARCLAHVLEMEGGWSDDPHDPGGPTNLGITLATFAAWTRRSVTAQTYGELRAELRQLSVSAARPIYVERYWKPSAAAHLPPALALFHFDAAVNHGIGGSARMLQEALGVEADGEIGPITLGAANAARLPRLLDTYAEIRRARYRALKHYWRFGKGWDRRVDLTHAAATSLLALSPSPPPSKPKEPAMQDTEQTTAQTPAADRPAPAKWWGNSLTIWGTIVTALATVLPVIGPVVGIDITAEMIRQLGQGVAQAIQAIGGVVGTALAIYGRIRAAQPLGRRDLSIRL